MNRTYAQWLVWLTFITLLLVSILFALLQSM